MSNDKSETKNITPIVLKTDVEFLKRVVIKNWSASDNNPLRLRSLCPDGMSDLKKENISNDHIKRNEAGIQNIRRSNAPLIKADITTATDAPSKLDSTLCS
jgi:hypothetical protein